MSHLSIFSTASGTLTAVESYVQVGMILRFLDIRIESRTPGGTISIATFYFVSVMCVPLSTSHRGQSDARLVDFWKPKKIYGTEFDDVTYYSSSTNDVCVEIVRGRGR